jgi:hypothetical protein
MLLGQYHAEYAADRRAARNSNHNSEDNGALTPLTMEFRKKGMSL